MSLKSTVLHLQTTLLDLWMFTLHWLKYHCNYKVANIDYLLVNLLNRDTRDIHGAMEDSKCLRDITLHVLQDRNETCLGYFESTDEFMMRTSKWTVEEEVFKDLKEELFYYLESTCTHACVENTTEGNICMHCNKIL